MLFEHHPIATRTFASSGFFATWQELTGDGDSTNHMPLSNVKKQEQYSGKVETEAFQFWRLQCLQDCIYDAEQLCC